MNKPRITDNLMLNLQPANHPTKEVASTVGGINQTVLTDMRAMERAKAMGRIFTRPTKTPMTPWPSTRENPKVKVPEKWAT